MRKPIDLATLDPEAALELAAENLKQATIAHNESAQRLNQASAIAGHALTRWHESRKPAVVSDATQEVGRW